MNDKIHEQPNYWPRMVLTINTYYGKNWGATIQSLILTIATAYALGIIQLWT